MRLFNIIIIFFTAVQCYGQNLYLNNIDTTREYPFEYLYHFKNSDDTSSYQLIKKYDEGPSFFTLCDNAGDTLCFMSIVIKNIKTDSVLNITTDFDGQGTFQFSEGEYEIYTCSLFDTFRITVNISHNEQIDLQIRLGRSHEVTIYKVHSRNELSEFEIKEIMNCVKQNRPNYWVDCDEQDKYYIMMQI